MNFYMCSGTDPRKQFHEPAKSNFVFVISFVLTIVFYTITVLRLRLRKNPEPVQASIL